MDLGRKRSLRTLVLFVDALLVLVAMGGAFSLHAALRPLLPLLREPPPFSAYAGLVVAALPLWLMLLAAFGLHRVVERVSTVGRLAWDLAKVHGAGLVGLSALLFVTQGVINRSMVGLFLTTSFALLFAERVLLGRWLRFRHREDPERILLVGADGAAMRRFLESAAERDYPPAIVGRLGVTSDGASVAPMPDALAVPRLGHVGDIERVLHAHPIDQVLFFPPLHDPEAAADALFACETVGATASFALSLPTPHATRPAVVQIGDDDFVTYEVAPKSPLALAVKHGFDLAASALGLLLLSPLLILVALAVLVTMGRPILYVQERAGRRGRPFRMLKFRSMVADADLQQEALRADDETGGPTFKMTRDPRITPFGRFLRRTSLDELPQLFNVLTGAMSLVGPRPLPIDEQQKIAGWHRRRLAMKPGITCIWQVSGRSDVGFEEWMELDLRYVDAWSLSLDLRLLLRTIPAVLFGRGAR